MSNSITAKRTDVKKMVLLAMFVALGYLCLFVFRIKVSFLTLEIKDLFITMSGFIFGPLAALGVAFVEALLEMVTLSDTGPWGALMNFCGSAAFACTASLIYKYKKNLFGAVLGLCTAVATMTAVMIVMNILITPIYMHAPRSVVYGMIPGLLLPFNLIKGALNGALLFVLYKPLSEALKGTGLIPKTDSYKLDKKTIIALAIAVVIIGGLFVLLKIRFGASVDWVRK